MINPYPLPPSDICHTCGSPTDKNQIQQICVALLDIQTSASDEQKTDHADAIAYAKSIMREYIRQATQNHFEFEN